MATLSLRITSPCSHLKYNDTRLSDSIPSISDTWCCFPLPIVTSTSGCCCAGWCHALCHLTQRRLLSVGCGITRGCSSNPIRSLLLLQVSFERLSGVNFDGRCCQNNLEEAKSVGFESFGNSDRHTAYRKSGGELPPSPLPLVNCVSPFNNESPGCCFSTPSAPRTTLPSFESDVPAS